MKIFICILIAILLINIFIIWFVHKFELYLHESKKKIKKFVFNKKYNHYEDIENDFKNKQK